MSEVVKQVFSSGDHTRFESYVSPNGETELDIIEFDQNHPEGKFGTIWEKSRSNLLAKRIRGSGRIAIRVVVNEQTLHSTTELRDDTAAYVPADTWYAWQSDYNEGLTVIATFTPAFDPNTHVVKTEEEIRHEV